MQKKNIGNHVSLLTGLCLFLMSLTGFSQNLLNGPQKIVIDTKHNRLLVSNANTGDLIEIDSAGNQSYFIQGADFVDGMEIVGDTLYGVGNNRKIRSYSLTTKQIVLELTLPGNPGDYLSSMTSDSAGCLFISCPLLNEIYKLRIRDHSFRVFAKGNGLNKPNGILLEKEKNRIVIIDDSPGSKIHAVNLADSSVSIVYSTSFQSPDGIIRDTNGNYYIGGYYLKGIYKIDSAFNKEPVLFFKGNSMVYPTYDARDNSILITHYDENTWERIPLKNP